MDPIPLTISIIAFTLVLMFLKRMLGKKEEPGFLKGQKERLKVKISEKKYLNHDVIRFTLDLPDIHQRLGISIGKHPFLKNKQDCFVLLIRYNIHIHEP